MPHTQYGIICNTENACRTTVRKYKLECKKPDTKLYVCIVRFYFVKIQKSTELVYVVGSCDNGSLWGKVT